MGSVPWFYLSFYDDVNQRNDGIPPYVLIGTFLSVVFLNDYFY